MINIFLLSLFHDDKLDPLKLKKFFKEKKEDEKEYMYNVPAPTRLIKNLI